MSNIPTPRSPVDIASSPPQRNYQEIQAQREDNHSEDQKARSKAIRLIRARTIVRMSPPASSSENSPVKSSAGSPERSPEASPTRPLRKSPWKPTEGSLQKPPKIALGKSPKKSSGKASKKTNSEQPSALSGQPVQLLQTQVPFLEPFPVPKRKNEKKKKQESSSREQSPASSNSEPVYQSFGIQTRPYILSSQSHPEQASSNHTFTVPSHGFPVSNPQMLMPYVDKSSLTQNSQTLQFGHYLVPQSQGNYASATSFEPEVNTNPEAYNQAQTMNTWGKPETTIEQDSNESDIAALTASLTLSAEDNVTSEQIAQQVRPGLVARRNTTVAARTTLPPIRESSREIAVTRSHAVLKPGFSIARDSQETQATPTPTEPSSPARSTDSPQVSNSYARPSSSISTQSSPSTRARVLTQKPEGFFWQLDSHGFPCASFGCDQRCNLWDGTSVICPKCGPYSEIRYCSKYHLLNDVKWHWLYCGQMAFEHPCRENSIPQQVKNGLPLIPCIHQYDTPERHRQAVYFNACAGQGDYFIFSDWADLVETGFLDNIALRCHSRVVHTVVFDDLTEKDKFRRVLAACLFFTIEVVELVDYMFRLIRDNLRSKAVWTKELDQALKYQLTQELSVQIHPQITGERHACEADWNGRNRRACRDTACRGEYRRFLGGLGGMGHRQLIDHVEASHWVLRAARSTHPEVGQAEARMQGEGFEQVLDDDRRKFCRGTGWDGAGSGYMEIEGVNA